MKNSKVSWEINTPYYVGITSNSSTKVNNFFSPKVELKTPFTHKTRVIR